MPKVKILNLPKYINGGTPPNCDPGYMPDPNDNTKCIPMCQPGQVYSINQDKCVSQAEYDAEQKALGNFKNWSSGATPNVMKSTGNEGTTANPMGNYNSNPNPFQYSTSVSGKPCPKGYYEDRYGRCVPRKRGIERLAETLGLAKDVGTNLAQIKTNKEVESDYEKAQRNKLFTGQERNPGKAFRFGNVETVSGVQFPGMLPPPNEGMFSNAYYGSVYPQVQFGGSFSLQGAGEQKPLRIKILETPEMKYGGQFKGSYGLDLGWRNVYTDMSKTDNEHYGETLSEDKNTDEQPVLEAEHGETLYKPGDSTLHNISGKRHSEGGVKLTDSQVSSKNSDISSFIFSDTKKLKIKDKDVLDHFGVGYKKGGVTPAKISKKFPLNKYKAILDDPHTDPRAKSTAQLMMDKNEKYLSQLVAIQEGMKGMEPPPFVKEKLAQSKLGGFVKKYALGGNPNSQTTLMTTQPPNSILGDFSDDYETLEKLLKDDSNKELRAELFNRYKTAHPKTTITEDDYIDNLLTAQKHNYAIAAAHENDPEFLKDPSWDWGDKAVYNKKTKKLIHGKGWKNKRYKEEVEKLGMTPLDEEGIKQFQQAYMDIQDAMQDPVFFQSFGKYFKTNPVGVADQVYKGKPISHSEGYYGNTTIGEKLQLSGWEEPKTTTTTTLPPEKVEPRYICVPDGKGGGQIKKLPDGMTGGYSSVEEASKNCGGRAVVPPSDYLLPDKLNMLATAAVFPELILPMTAKQSFIPGSLNLEDWRAPAATAFSTQYAAPAQQLAQYTSPQALMANLSALSGQTGQTITGQIMPGVIGRNVDRVNAFSQAEGQRQDEINRFNLLQKQKAYEGWATAKQQYSNSIRKYLKENSDAFTRAWNNRMMLGLVNATNTKFYLDATSGAPVFYNANTRGVAGLPSGSSSTDDSSKLFNSYYTAFYKAINNPDISEEDRKKAAFKLAMDKIKAGSDDEEDTSTTKSPFSFG